MSYETVIIEDSDAVLFKDAQFKYENLDISSKHLGVDELGDIFHSLVGDTVIKCVNFGGNVTINEASRPSQMEKLFKSIRALLVSNRTIIMLRTEDNFLFEFVPSPFNEHKKNYLLELTNILSTSRIKRLDISGNNVIGKSGTQLKGLSTLCREFLQTKADAFVCRRNGLNSQAFAVVADALGVYSNITYLDLSDNCGGLGSFQEPNSQGTYVLGGQLQQTVHLRALKLARNHLGDIDFQNIAQAISGMLHLQYLDLSGNKSHAAGMTFLAQGLASICPCMAEGDGIQSVRISNNPFGPDGAAPVCDFVKKTGTLRTLDVSSCSFDNDAMNSLQQALMTNVTILNFENAGNPVTPLVELKTKAAVEVNQLLVQLQSDPLSVDSNDFTKVVYDTLVHKLKHLPQEVLVGLHGNPSFNVPLTPLQQELHLLAAPGRKALINKVIKEDEKLPERLRAVSLLDQRMKASVVICRAITPWFRKIQQKKMIRLALLEAKKREEADDGRIRDDSDTYTFWKK